MNHAKPLRVLLLASLPAVAMFLAVGNVVELRMYGELVPVLGVGLLKGAGSSR